MAKIRVKFLLWVLSGFVTAGLLWSVVSGLGRFVAYFQEGADPADALNAVPDIPLEQRADLTWLPDDGDIGRPMEPFTRRQITSDYLRARHQLNLSFQEGEPRGLKTYFVGQALEAATDSVAAAAYGEWQVRLNEADHMLRLHFYSADGSIVSFSDAEVTIQLSLHDRSGQRIHSEELEASYEVVMLQADGNWRILHLVQQSGPNRAPHRGRE